jgi:hypothetical protein
VPCNWVNRTTGDQRGCGSYPTVSGQAGDGEDDDQCEHQARPDNMVEGLLVAHHVQNARVCHPTRQHARNQTDQSPPHGPARKFTHGTHAQHSILEFPDNTVPGTALPAEICHTRLFPISITRQYAYYQQNSIFCVHAYPWCFRHGLPLVNQTAENIPYSTCLVNLCYISTSEKIEGYGGASPTLLNPG